MEPLTLSQAHSPLLCRYSTKRISGSEIPGYYSSERHVWIIEKNHNKVPIINLQRSWIDSNLEKNTAKAQACIELVTKTDVMTERDDTDFDNTYNLLELQTKTEANTEQDDEMGNNLLLELLTKTKVDAEQDDETDWL